LAAANVEGNTPLQVAMEDDRTEMVLWLGMSMAAKGLPIEAVGLPAMGAPAAAGASAAASSSSSGSGGCAAASASSAMADEDEDEDMGDDLPAGVVPTAFPDA
jgi:hypothetical protein